MTYRTFFEFEKTYVVVFDCAWKLLGFQVKSESYVSFLFSMLYGEKISDIVIKKLSQNTMSIPPIHSLLDEKN